MLTEIYMEARLVDDDLADQVWGAAGDPKRTDSEIALFG